MTTPVAQSEELATREKLPPVERNSAPDAQMVAAPVPTAATTTATVSHEVIDPSEPASSFAKSTAHWIHNHPEAHKHGAGIWVYQIVRSAIAAIPYGLSMAGTLAAFTQMDRTGSKLAEKGASEFTRGFGRNLMGFAKFQPAKMAALIGTSFTFYRGTSKLGKWMTEYLFNPKDSEARTAEKVDDLPQEAWRKIKEIAPAEVGSTPISAVVLGFIVSAFQKPFNFTKEVIAGGKTIQQKEIQAEVGFGKAKKMMNIDWTRDNFLSAKGWDKLKIMGSAIGNPKAKFVQQAAINSFGYALFFELGDRLFKDIQIRRGVWPGEHHSIKALKAAPDEYEQGIKDGNEISKPKYADGALEAVKEKHRYPFFTSEPSLGRFVFRRLLPTAAGITLYTGTKMRWASMLGNKFEYAEGKLAPQILNKAWGEGAATSLFFLIPIISEPWEKIYDNFFANKEKKAKLKEHPELAVAKTLNAHQEQKYEELLGRVNAKEQTTARSA